MPHNNQELAEQHGWGGSTFGKPTGANPRTAGRLGGLAKLEKEKAKPIPEYFGPGGSLRSRGFADMTPERRAEIHKKSLETRRAMPQPLSQTVSMNSTGFKSFAQKIRHKTNDGWELIEAVYEVFTRARANNADQLIIESATWLADRGFGKPVQVGQLLDAEGNAVAFTLWSPATQEPVGDIITIQGGHVVENEDSQRPYEPSAAQLEGPKPYERPAKDGYAEGVARAWASNEPEPKGGK